MREPGRRSSRDGAALAGAVVVHALALLLLGRLAPRAVVPLPTAALPVVDAVDVELLPSEPSTALHQGPVELSTESPSGSSTDASPATAGPTSIGSAPARGSSVAAAEPATRTRHATPSAALELADGAPPAAAPAETPGASPSGAPAERPIDLGLGADGWKRWLSADRTQQGPRADRAPGTPVVRAPPVSSSGGLVEGLAEADRERIVGPGGRVVNALENAAHGDGSAAFGVARFAVTVLRTGNVEVTLESASGGEAEWKRVAERAAQDLRANAPPIKPPNQGEHFIVDLSAEMRMPDGRRVAELFGPRVQAVTPRIHTWQAGQKDMADKNPTAASGLSRTDQMMANVELPGVYVAQNGKVCSYRFGLSILGPRLQGGCELENIGSKPQRVVHAHVTRSELF